MICTHCGNDFTGRPNRSYCSRICKKRAENGRNRFKHLLYQYPRLITQQEQARAAGDWHQVRLTKAKAERVLAEIERADLTGHDWLLPFVVRLEALLIRPRSAP
jgi:hypothetical protein